MKIRIPQMDAWTMITALDEAEMLYDPERDLELREPDAEFAEKCYKLRRQIEEAMKEEKS
jgi:hypothetical protein